MDHRLKGFFHRPAWRFPRPRLWAMVCAILILYLLAQACLMHWKLTRWQQAMASHELCITAGQMSESLRKYPPFDEFPAPNAGRITILNRSLGLVGDETWARFEFAREQDFKAYMQSVTSHPLVAEDAKMAFDYEMRLGPILARLMKQDLATSGVRATMPGLPSKQWIFLPQQRRVLSTCTD